MRIRHGLQRGYRFWHVIETFPLRNIILGVFINRMDRKGILTYLAVTFFLGWVVTPLLVSVRAIVFEDPSLLNNAVFLLAMFFPALGALAASQFAQESHIEGPRLWPLPTARVIQAAIAVPCIFAFIYLITALFGWSEPQWRMGTLMNEIDLFLMRMQQPPLSPEVRAVAPGVALAAGFFFSILAGPTFFAVLALGNELGWRGYLLPHLMPLGRFRAYLITGLLWGIWFFPMIWMGYTGLSAGGGVWGFMARFLGLALVLSVVLGEVCRRTGYLGLSAVVLGCFAVQLDSIWGYLFPISSPPWTGPFGLISIVVWAVVAMIPVIIAGPDELSHTEE